jgi:cytochrome c biogenesis protein ResB
MATVDSGPARRAGRIDLPDPLYPIWRWLTSVRVAVMLIAIVALFALTGVIIPQVPPQFVDSPALVAQHIEAQRPTWGSFTDPIAEFPWFYDANGGIFNLFDQPYWFALVAVLALAITTCTISRFPPIWRTVRRPQRRVNDRYFERARHRLDFAIPASIATIGSPAAPDVIVGALRRRRYRVRAEQRDGATYLFAERFQWAQLATFVSHLALILLVIGALVTKFAGEEIQFWVGEGQSHPLFETGGDRQQVQVIVDDAIARFNDEGQALDFRSLVRVTTGGSEVAAGEVTVNGPLQAAGFRVHQAAYWEHGAALQVHDASSGQLLYSEVLMLQDQFFGPRIVMTDAAAGTVFADEVVQLPHQVAGIEGGAYELISLADEVSLALILLPDDAGSVRFHYTLLPLAAGSEAGAQLDSQALRIGLPLPVAPRLRLRDPATGEELLDSVVPLQDRALASGITERLGLLPLPDGTLLTVGYAGADRRFFYFDTSDESARGLLAAGEAVRVGGVLLEYVGEDADRGSHGTLSPGAAQVIGRVELTYGGAESIFFASEEDIPGAPGEALVAIERFGQARTTSEFNAFGGEDVELDRSTVSGRFADRPARLVLGLGGDASRIDLDEGKSRVVGDYEYSFLGPREFTGLNLRRNPGGSILWAAILLGTGGLLTTFFVPRRRVWAKITSNRVYLAGLAGHGVQLRREFLRLGREVGAPGISDDEEDEEEAWDR